LNTRTGLAENILCVLAYLLIPGFPIAAVVFLLLEQDNNFVKFHSIQSLFLSLVEFIFFSFICIVTTIISTFLSFLSFFSCFIGIFNLLLWLVFIALRVFLAVKAYNNEYHKLPVLGDQVERIVFKR